MGAEIGRFQRPQHLDWCACGEIFRASLGLPVVLTVGGESAWDGRLRSCRPFRARLGGGSTWGSAPPPSTLGYVPAAASRLRESKEVGIDLVVGEDQGDFGKDAIVSSYLDRVVPVDAFGLLGDSVRGTQSRLHIFG